MAKKQKVRSKPGALSLVSYGGGFRASWGRYDVGRVVRSKKGRSWIAVTPGGLRVATAPTAREAAERLLPVVGVAALEANAA